MRQLLEPFSAMFTQNNSKDVLYNMFCVGKKLNIGIRNTSIMMHTAHASPPHYEVIR